MNDSVAYRQARKILTQNRWELEDGSKLHVIYEEEGSFVIATLAPDGNEWYIDDELDASLWFGSYKEARNYFREECYVDGRFKRIEVNQIK